MAGDWRRNKLANYLCKLSLQASKRIQIENILPRRFGLEATLLPGGVKGLVAGEATEAVAMVVPACRHHLLRGEHLARAAWAGSQLRLPHDGGRVQRHRLRLCLLTMNQLIAVDAVDLRRIKRRI